MIFRKQKKQSLFDRTVSPRISARMNNLTSFRCCSCCSCQCYSCVMSRYSGFQNVNPQTFLFGQPVHTYPNTYFVQQNHLMKFLFVVTLLTTIVAIASAQQTWQQLLDVACAELSLFTGFPSAACKTNCGDCVSGKNHFFFLEQLAQYFSLLFFKLVVHGVTLQM